MTIISVISGCMDKDSTQAAITDCSLRAGTMAVMRSDAMESGRFVEEASLDMVFVRLAACFRCAANRLV